jgi:hypothetical protein
MDILGIVGFVFAATAAGVLVYEHQTDVLRGPYIEGRAQPRHFAAMFDPARAVASAVIGRLNWNARHVVYLASLA